MRSPLARRRAVVVLLPGLTLCREYFELAIVRKNGPWALDCRACALLRLGEGRVRGALSDRAYVRLRVWVLRWPIVRVEEYFPCPWPNLLGRFLTWDSDGVRLL